MQDSIEKMDTCTDQDQGDSDKKMDPNSKFKMPMLKHVSSVDKKQTATIEAAFPVNEDSPEVVMLESKEKKETVLKTKSESAKEMQKFKKKDTGLSPAECLKENESVIPYKEPTWGGICENNKYHFEAIKNGTLADKVDLNVKSFYVFGRLPSCDYSMDHPSVSRYHTVIQYRRVADNDNPEGWYLFDLDSTHGTWINKHQVKPRTYYRLRVGYVVKFGGSSRLYILHGPETDQDEESELSASEMKAQRDKQKKEADLLHQLGMLEAEEMARKQAERDSGCMWGMDEIDHAEDDDDDTVNPFAAPEPLNEDLYIDDPKKSLRGYYEREGLDLPEYEFTEEGLGKFKCRLELPIDMPSGEPMYAEVMMTGKKKDIVVACALEACRILDRHGVLRKSHHEGRAKKRKNWEDADYYDSDDDNFLDRTGAVEKKREKRILRANRSEDKAETYESLTKKLEEVVNEMTEIEKKLEDDKQERQAMEEEGLDELDAFMMSIKSGGLDTRSKVQMKHRLVELRHLQMKFERLVKIARPCEINIKKTEETKPTKLPIFGKMKGTSKPNRLVPNVSCQTSAVKANDDSEVVEEEEDEEEEEEDKSNDKMVVEHITELTQTKTVTNESKVDSSSSRLSQAISSRLQGLTEPETDSKSSIVPETEIQFRTLENEQFHKSGTQVQQSRNKINERKQIDVKPKKKMSTQQDDVDPLDPKYASWLPPPDQRGDGKTKLNEKFGY